MKYPAVILNPGREQSLLRKHQWIFSKAIKRIDKSVGDGDIVSVVNASNEVLATGHYYDSSLAIRILEFGEATIDQVFWKRKLEAAFTYRKAIGLFPPKNTNAFRLVHGEGDELPGLIVDIYDRVAVLQAHSTGMYRQRMEIAQALAGITELQLKGIFDKSIESTRPDHESSEQDWIAGSGEETLHINENGIAFVVDIKRGQKTGFFLDQRNNRQFVKSFAQDKDVLNCFCYTGGFSLYALSGGAKSVTSIDTSANAIAMLEHNLKENEFTGTHQSVTGDVMQFLTQTTETYDLIICDPPAFAKSIHKRHNAIQAYKRLNALAMKKIRPGGMLFTFSCSQVVDRQLFNDTVVAAAIEIGRPIRVMFEMSQGPDHPVSVFHPEGSYLKGLALSFQE